LQTLSSRTTRSDTSHRVEKLKQNIALSYEKRHIRTRLRVTTCY
jgi:hypothetical protein